ASTCGPALESSETVRMVTVPQQPQEPASEAPRSAKKAHHIAAHARATASGSPVPVLLEPYGVRAGWACTPYAIAPLHYDEWPLSYHQKAPLCKQCSAR